MATPVINELLLPDNRILVLPDPGENPTTGTIFQRSTMGGGRFLVGSGGGLGGESEYNKVLFIREMTTEVEIDGVEYLAMSADAIVGLIP